MAVACASRFAVLKLEDEETVAATNKSTKINNEEAKQSNETKPKQKKKKKKNSQEETSDLQNLAFGVTKVPKPKANQQSKSSNQPTEGKQWEEWKKKDAKFVDTAYEKDLQEALILSKIDFEEKKDIYDAIQKETETNKSNNSNQKKKNKNNQKKDKHTPMTLEDFRNLSTSEINTGMTKKNVESNQDKNCSDDKFFDKLDEAVEEIIHKENTKEAISQRLESYRDDHIRNIQYKDELEKKDLEIAKLREEINRLKSEIKTLKDKKKLMSKLLFEGEMQDKAEILIQVDQITKVKDELTEQVAELHTALEQERSKVHTLTTELKKYQSKKKESK